MSKCQECERKFPEELLNPMMVNGEFTKPICAICALELRNKVHGLNDTKFHGTRAQEILKETRKYLAKRGNHD